MSVNAVRYKCLFAIVAITVICIMAMHEGLDGQFYSICVALIGALGGMEAYDLIRREKDEP